MKRKQKGSEDEQITGGPVTVNGNSSEVLYLLDPAPRFVHARRQYFAKRHGKPREVTRSRRPIRAIHDVSQATSDNPEVLDRNQASQLARSSMFEKWNKRREQMMLRESDDRVVPMPSSESDKPGNAGAGKAEGISRDPDLAPPVLSDGTAVIIRLFRSHTFAIGVLERMPSFVAACTPPRGAGMDRCVWPVCKGAMKWDLGAVCVNSARTDLRGVEGQCGKVQIL